jgi:hypothetical protein
MQNDKVLLQIKYIVLSMFADALCIDLRVSPLVKYLRLYSSLNLLARALRFTASMFLRAGDTRIFLSSRARPPLSCEEVLYGLLTADMQVKLKIYVY